MFKNLKTYSLNVLSTFFAFIIMMAAGSFSSAAYAFESNSQNEPDQYVQIQLIADQTNVQGGETIKIGIKQTIYPGWHTYWKNPGDSGTPLTIEWNLPKGFKASDLQWPTAKKIPYDILTNYGYENQVILLQDLTVPKNIDTSAPIKLNASVNLLVCHDICIPEQHNASLTLNGDTTPNAEKIKTAINKLPTTLNADTSFFEQDQNFIVDVKNIDTAAFTAATNIAFLPEDWGTVDNNANALLNVTDSGLQIIQKRGERDLSELQNLPFVLNYTDQNNIEKSVRFIANATNGETLQNSTSFSWFLFSQAILFALLGGLILNLMPCVFPVLSMKALSLINLKGKEEKKARGYGLSYTAGILLSFGAIAATLLLLKAGGAQIGWGFQLQNPTVIILLTYLVFIISLNLSGFFEFSGRLSGIGQKLSQGTGNRSAFFTGVLATLVATPCTAPFMGAAMGFALTQPAIVSMSVFLALGFGLALPYLALCYIPALRSKLPRPGAWMETFRQILSFPMFITAAWLLWVASQQIDSISLFYVLVNLIAIIFIIWLMRNLAAEGLKRSINIILMIATSLFVILSPITLIKMEHHNQSNATSLEQTWESYSPEKLSELIEGDDSIFVNMTASWCITCKVNEKIALKPQKTQELFVEKNIQYLKGDWTNQDPEITKYLQSFNRQGVPLYVFYGARDTQTGKRPEPVLLPQILTATLVQNTISQTP